MYDRAPRVVSQTCGSTAVHVGPGTYDASLPDPKKLRNDGYAPFLSMTSRDTFLNPGDSVVAAPGPGQYDPVYPQETVRGGKTLANKSQRFKIEAATPKETPGPGAYNLSKRSDWIKEMNRNASAPANLDGQKVQTNLMSNRIKFHRKPEAPSIPSPGKAYGYEENEDGTLKKQDPPNADNSMGPAYYSQQPGTDANASVLYKGVHFGRLTSKRMDFSGKDGPGPGEYEPYRESQNKIEHVNLRESDKARFEARIPRYHEMVVHQEEKKAVPGPGKYEVRGTFDQSPPKVNTEGIEVEHPPFGSQAKRFGPIKGEAPAPGAYNDPRTAFESTKKITGLKRSPFGQTSIRFTPEHHTKKTPGPGAYNVVGMGSDSMRKAYIESTRRGAFGTTSIRIQPMTKVQEVELPGPGHYQPKEKPYKPRYQQLSSTFASLSNRLTEPPQVVKSASVVPRAIFKPQIQSARPASAFSTSSRRSPAEDLPPPGSYEVDRAFSRTQGKLHPGKPRTDAAKKKQGAFQSSSSRFAPPRDVVINEADPSMPGPGTYDAKFPRDKKGNLMISKDRRFKDIKSDVPGPGTYEFSPLLQDTVLRGTFNATLNNPIVPRMDNLGAPTTSNHPFLLGV